ncbi:TIR domain-containing protein [Vibrio sp. 10N.222.55.B11]|uniref:TIR domain-containing protein n=1 Tax=Vibrio sp. 10N.222.55.B11 TaxID=3229648 RepID=UPI003552A960
MSKKTKLFIASSVEGLSFAEAIKAGLEHSSIRAEIWTQGVFKANGYPLQQLEDAMDKYDYGLFVMTPDDLVERRGEELRIARDNVLLELGMFIGCYGKEFCFILTPRGVSSPKMPSDMTGFQTLDYDPEWANENIDAALGTACRNLKLSIEESVAEYNQKLSTDEPEVVIESEGLTEDQFSVLSILFEAEKRLSAGMLGRMTETNKNIIQVILSELVDKRLVSVSRGHCLVDKICAMYQINTDGTREYMSHSSA